MKLLVVDDDRELLPLIAFALRQSGFFVLEAEDGAAALHQWREERPDLVILDLNLPDMDGFAVCARIRAESETVPILILTARDSEETEVHGLSQGADDFLRKPFSPKVLLARIRSLLRRTGGSSTGELGALRLIEDLQALSIAGGTPFRLTPLEYRLTQLLMANSPKSVRTDQILMHVWGQRGAWERQRLKQLVLRLRRKLERNPAEPTRLITTADGYMLQEP